MLTSIKQQKVTRGLAKLLFQAFHHRLTETSKTWIPERESTTQAMRLSTVMWRWLKFSWSEEGGGDPTVEVKWEDVDGSDGAFTDWKEREANARFGSRRVESRRAAKDRLQFDLITGLGTCKFTAVNICPLSSLSPSEFSRATLSPLSLSL